MAEVTSLERVWRGTQIERVELILSGTVRICYCQQYTRPGQSESKCHGLADASPLGPDERERLAALSRSIEGGSSA